MTPQGQSAATYFDGVTSVAHAVILKLEASAIAITSPEGVLLARWYYVEIAQLPSIADRLWLRLAESNSTARLGVRDSAFATYIKQHLGFTPQRDASERRRRRLVVGWSAAAVAAVLAMGVAGLPAIAELLTPLVSPAMEARIGEAIQKQAITSYQTKEGPVLCGEQGEREKAGKAAFDKLFRQLETAANLPIPIRAYIIRTQNINAAAIPGGYLHFNLGMIQFSESPEEFAGVIGHEIGHLAHRHGLRGHLHALGLTYLVAMAVGDIFTATGVLVAAHGTLHRAHGRAQERQADAYGVQLMAKLGADTHAAANLWERLAKLEMKEDAKMPPRALLSLSHPGSLERAATIRATPKVENPKPMLTAEEWRMLKDVCSPTLGLKRS